MVHKWAVLALIIFSFASCGDDCQNKPQAQFEMWKASEPSSYAYTVSKSYYTSSQYLGPYRFHVVDGAIDTVYYAPEFFPVDSTFLFEGWDDYEIVKEYSFDFDMDSVFEFIIKNDEDCSTAYDQVFHFPKSYAIASDPDISDSGYSVIITNFEEL